MKREEEDLGGKCGLLCVLLLKEGISLSSSCSLLATPPLKTSSRGLARIAQENKLILARGAVEPELESGSILIRSQYFASVYIFVFLIKPRPCSEQSTMIFGRSVNRTFRISR